MDGYPGVTFCRSAVPQGRIGPMSCADHHDLLSPQCSPHKITQESKQENTSTDDAMRKLWRGVDPIGIKQDSWDITREEQSEFKKKKETLAVWWP